MSEALRAGGGERARIARNAASSYAVRGLLAVSALLLTPYLFRRLGVDGFGTWSVIFTLWTMFELLETGFTSGIVKLTAEFRGRGDRAELERAVGAGVVLTSVLGLLALLLAAAGGLLLDGLAAEGYEREFRWGMVAMGFALLVRYPLSAYAAALKGYQRYDLYNVTQAIVVGGLIVGSVLAVELGTAVVGISVAFGVSLALGGVAAAVLLRRVDPDLPLRPRLDRESRSRLLGFSSYALLADSMVFAGQRMDVVIVAAVRNAATAAPYAAALKLQSAVQALTLPLVGLLLPMIAELWARGERDEVVRRLVLATRLALQVTLPVAAGLALFASDVVGFWLGADAPAVTATIVVLLMAVQVVMLTTAPAEKVLLGIGKVRALGGLAVIEGVANVTLTIVLVSAYGAVGAALGTLATAVAVAPLRLPLTARAVGLPFRELLLRGILPAVLSAAPALAAMVAIRVVLEEGIVRAGAGLVLGCGLAALVAARQLSAAGALGRQRERMAPAGPVASVVDVDVDVDVDGDLTAAKGL